MIPIESNMNDTTKPTVLIIEDNEEMAMVLKKRLGLQYNILVAPNGEEGLKVVHEHIVHLIISDVMMPVMDGIEFCEKIKSDINTSHIPVILLTARNGLQAKIEGLSQGAEAYIEKPFSIDHLEAQIISLLQNRTRIKQHFVTSPLTQFKSIGPTKKDEVFLEMLQQLIEKHMAEDNLDIDFLVKAVNMSRTSFYRKIKSISNLSLYEMINLTRLKKAAALINEGTHNLSEIAIIVGFTSLAHFGRSFKKQFGMSPSEYIKKK